MFAIPLPLSSPTVALLVAILHVLLAGLVTADVLLKKSDVRGALGWIGAVWFAPIFGSLLYYLFGINRVTRRALKLGRLDDTMGRPPAPVQAHAAPNIVLLSEVSEKISQSPLTSGNELTILEG